MESLSERLRTARGHAHLSSVQASKLTGINYKTLNNYEHGVSKPDVGKLSVICKVYHVSADYFVQPEIDNIESSSAPAQAKAEELTAGQQRLLHNFDSMNSDGQERLLTMSDDMVASGRYIKDNSSVSKEA